MTIKPDAVLNTVKLLLPALIPSWRFFDFVAPSPRIEFALLTSAQETAADWREFRPRPARLSVLDMLRRMLWNPRWNESLFLVSCAERLMENPTRHSADEILSRIRADLARGGRAAGAPAFLRFRLVFVSRRGEELQKEVTYVSPVHRVSASAAP